MKVSINNRTKIKIDEDGLVALVVFFAKYYNLDNRELSIAIIGDKAMRRLNNEYRNIDKPTDILSFEGEDDFLGELIIDYSQVKRQAPYFSKNVGEEFLFIVVHGLLHLIGYDDQEETDRDIMMDKGGKILTTFLDKQNAN